MKEQSAGDLYDACTGLCNRRMLMERLHHCIAKCGRINTPGALVFLDLDGFKQVNDQFGHTEGDRLLKLVACRIRQGIRQSDTAARYGGDEFVVLLDPLSSAEDAEMITERILESINLPYSLSEKSANVGASVGISIFPHDGSCAEIILEKADAAMYRAKQSGGGKILRYHSLECAEN